MSLLERFQSIRKEMEAMNAANAAALEKLEAQGVRSPMVGYIADEKNQWAAAHAHALAGGLAVWPGQTVEMQFTPDTGDFRITRRKPANLNIHLLLAGGSIKNKRSLGAFRGWS